MHEKKFWFGNVLARNFDRESCILTINYNINGNCSHNYVTVATTNSIHVLRLDFPRLAYRCEKDNLVFIRYSPLFVNESSEVREEVPWSPEGTLLTSTSRATYLVTSDSSSSVIKRLFFDAELAEYGIFNVSLVQFPYDSSILSIASGHDHTLLLTNEGTLFSFGTGNHGELGLLDTLSISEPTIVYAFEGLRIKKIAAGGWHSLALTDSNDVYVWGWNIKGQLGDEVEDIESLPAPLSIDHEVIDIEARECYTQITIRNENGATSVLTYGIDISF
ncbi:unnamed protein product [Auanema sp. JU1783]|nr:unnamed protein product [Auanema sp. JU1783]